MNDEMRGTVIIFCDGIMMMNRNVSILTHEWNFQWILQIWKLATIQIYKPNVFLFSCDFCFEQLHATFWIYDDDDNRLKQKLKRQEWRWLFYVIVYVKELCSFQSGRPDTLSITYAKVHNRGFDFYQLTFHTSLEKRAPFELTNKCTQLAKSAND